jgi:hypothetical protein
MFLIGNHEFEGVASREITDAVFSTIMIRDKNVEKGG